MGWFTGGVVRLTGRTIDEWHPAIVVFAVVLIFGQHVSASPINLSFTSYSNSDPVDSAIAESQFSATAESLGTDQVIFKFFNSVGEKSSLTNIYFSDDLLLFNYDSDQVEIGESIAGVVNYSLGANPNRFKGSDVPGFTTIFAAGPISHCTLGERVSRSDWHCREKGPRGKWRFSHHAKSPRAKDG